MREITYKNLKTHKNSATKRTKKICWVWFPMSFIIIYLLVYYNKQRIYRVSVTTNFHDIFRNTISWFLVYGESKIKNKKIVLVRINKSKATKWGPRNRISKDLMEICSDGNSSEKQKRNCLYTNHFKIKPLSNEIKWIPIVLLFLHLWNSYWFICYFQLSVF